MASLGAKVVQPNAGQASMINNIPIHVSSTFSEKSGTKIISESDIDYKKVVTGVAYSKNDAKVTLVGVADKPGVAAAIFEPFGENNINIDMVIQTAASDGKKTDVTFTVKREDLLKTLKLFEKNKQYLNYQKIIHDDKVSKVSIIGAGMVSNPGVVYKMFSALGYEQINILAISTSEIKISVLVQEDMTQKAVKTLHKKFELD